MSKQYTKLSEGSIKFALDAQKRGIGTTTEFSLVLAKALSAYNRTGNGVDSQNQEKTGQISKRVALMGDLSIINEVIIIDVNQVLHYLDLFDGWRKRIVNDFNLITYVGSKNAVSDFFNISSFFSKDDIEVINKNPAALGALSIDVRNLLKDLGIYDNGYFID